MAGYKIYYGTGSSQYDTSVDVANPGVINGVVLATVSGLEDGTTYYFAVTAYDSDGFESNYSQEVFWTTPEVFWTTPVEEPVLPLSPPVANDLSFSFSEDMAGKGQLTGQSSSGLTLTYQIVTNASKGTARITDSRVGTFSYTPQSNINGIDSFTYIVRDANGESDIATVDITINAVNDAPVAFDGTLNTRKNELAAGVLKGTDVDGDQLTFSIVSNGLLGSASIVDPETGTYTYTPNEGMYGEGAFQFAVSDETGESSKATVTVTIQQANPVFVMEIGEINVDGTWAFVSFAENFSNPVVVAKPASSNDSTPCVVRIRNLSSSGFEIRLQNYDYIAEEHGVEHISYVAIEQGSFNLENGKRVEAGIFTTNLNDGLEIIAFAEQFPIAPVVAASIVTENEDDAVVGRLDNITKNGFDYQMQEQEANRTWHTYEKVAYIAWEPFTGLIGNMAFDIHVAQDEVDDQWQALSFRQVFDRAPVFIADMQSQYGPDTANLRHTELKATGVKIRVAEEQSDDWETYHAYESFGFIAIADIDLKGDDHNDGPITADEQDLYGTIPGMADTDGGGLDNGAEVTLWNEESDSAAADNCVNTYSPSQADSDNDGLGDACDPTDGNTLANNWVNIYGNITFNGQSVCAMVLANGQFMYTCSGDGSFNMDVPLDGNGQITFYSFASGFDPFLQVISPSAGVGMAVEMSAGGDETPMDISYTIGEAVNNLSWVRLSGNITYQGNPVCGMALANGQHMFTCSGDGSFDLEVPLTPSNGISLYGFVCGLPPYLEEIIVE